MNCLFITARIVMAILNGVARGFALTAQAWAARACCRLLLHCDFHRSAAHLCSVLRRSRLLCVTSQLRVCFKTINPASRHWSSAFASVKWIWFVFILQSRTRAWLIKYNIQYQIFHFITFIREIEKRFGFARNLEQLRSVCAVT